MVHWLDEGTWARCPDGAWAPYRYEGPCRCVPCQLGAAAVADRLVVQDWVAEECSRG